MTLRTLIVDDEPLAREGLADYVQQIDFLEEVAQAKDAVEAMSILDKQPVDLLLLDINMPRLSGIEFLKTVSDPPLTIFTTAYPNYALKGYELNVIDYLVKPITFPRFLAAVIKARKQFTLLQSPSPAFTDDQPAQAQHFFIRVDGRTERIQPDDFLFAEAMQNYVQIHTTERTLMPLLSMKALEEQLPQPHFYRVHKSFLVNLQKVQAIEGNQLLLGGRHKVPVSRSKAAAVQEIILKGRLLE